MRDIRFRTLIGIDELSLSLSLSLSLAACQAGDRAGTPAVHPIEDKFALQARARVMQRLVVPT